MVHPTRHEIYTPQKTTSVINLLRSRELRGIKCIDINQIPESSSRLPFVWQRRTLNPGDRNKIFACQWITNNHIVYGTKCNNLVLYDCNSNESFDIPLIKSENQDATSPINRCACGIHSIQLNTSKTFLATGGDNVNHVGVYRLTEFSPHCLLSDCHKDWVFDLRWLDDTCLASCSRDSSLALWRIPSSDENVSGRVNNSIHKNTGVKSGTSVLHIKSPVAYAKSSLSDDRFRALEYLPTQTNLAVVSMSRRLYLYDAVRMGLDKHTRPIYTLVLRNAYPEAVALRRWPSEPNCIALATHHCVLLFDIRCSTTKIGSEARCILPPLDVAGVRSLNFSKSILSYGTSSGRVHFYDLRNDHHLPKQLDIGPGWVKPQNCDDYEIPAVASLLNSLSRPVASQSQTTTTGWNVPSPPPSPAHPVLITSSSNIVRPIQPQHQQQSQSEAFATQVTNLHLRLNRINNRILNLHSRHRALSMYPIMNRSTSRRSNNTHNRNGIIRQNSITTTTTTTSAEDVATSSLSESNFPDVDDDNNNNDDDDNDDDGNDGGGDADGDDTHPATNNDTAIVNPVDINNNDINVLSSGGGRGRGGGESRRITLGMNFFADLNFDLFSFPTIFNQRRMLAVYTHEYDPSGTRLFTAGGPIASTFHGNVAALWE